MKIVSMVLVMILATFVTGCGKSDIQTAPVSGTVTFAGNPLGQGTITFIPKSGARPGTGTIVDGRITTVTTLHSGDGAPLGPCAITVTAMDTSGGMQSKPTSLIPERYARDVTSGLETVIKPGTNTVTIDLTK